METTKEIREHFSKKKLEIYDSYLTYIRKLCAENKISLDEYLELTSMIGKAINDFWIMGHEEATMIFNSQLIINKYKTTKTN